MKDEGRMMKYPWKSPQDDLAAEQLINPAMRDGYHRYDEELADAKQAILGS